MICSRGAGHVVDCSVCPCLPQILKAMYLCPWNIFSSAVLFKLVYMYPSAYMAFLVLPMFLPCYGTISSTVYPFLFLINARATLQRKFRCGDGSLSLMRERKMAASVHSMSRLQVAHKCATNMCMTWQCCFYYFFTSPLCRSRICPQSTALKHQYVL